MFLSLNWSHTRICCPVSSFKLHPVHNLSEYFHVLCVFISRVWDLALKINFASFTLQHPLLRYSWIFSFSYSILDNFVCFSFSVIKYLKAAFFQFFLSLIFWNFILSYCQAQFKFSTSSVQFELRLSLKSNYFYPHPPTPTRDSRNETLLDYLGSWNLVYKLYSTKLGQLSN